MLTSIVAAYGVAAQVVTVPDDEDPERAVLFYDSGEVRFQHTCKLVGDDNRLVCAPLLQIGHGHTVVTIHPLTIVASLLCDDCGTHGFVTAGEWQGC